MLKGLAGGLLFLVLSATPALAVSRQSGSDDYVCSHGRPEADATQEACARLHATGNEPVEDTAPTPEPVAPSGPAEFQRGQADRARYEAWFHGLAGETLAGASYWEANRSVSGHSPCDASGVPSTGAEWTRGCFAARDQLADPDRRRLSSPEYRYGWNHPTANVDTSRAPPAPPGGEATTPAVPDAATSAASSDTGAPAASPSAATTTPPGGYTGLAAVGLLVIVLIVLGCAAVYFLPTLIAFGRRKRNAGAILALNLFLGWTLLGWVLALVWSLTVDPPAQLGLGSA
ncbi:superinfection immunity protein [Caulobacter sp. KR2-114]|uniref:superinfection immunity protein n=1 Tax=Caulobacter sp. KR2-114 TaxID=3400912 RepID=UPI003C044F3A